MYLLKPNKIDQTGKQTHRVDNLMVKMRSRYV
jgi:hypothetical protein